MRYASVLSAGLALLLTFYVSGGCDRGQSTSSGPNQEVRIGFDREDNQLNEGFKPEWHHIFPKKIMRDFPDETLVDSFANIVVLNEKANRSFGAKPPLQYLKEHNVQRERLDEQAIPDNELLEVKNFEKFVTVRAENLAERSTAYVQELSR